MRWKEEYWGKDGYKFRSLGGIDVRKNPDTGASGGSYAENNWGLMPSDPGFVDSARVFYCNHEYKKPSRDSWATNWVYSGANVQLRGYNCPAGTLWDSDAKGCLTLHRQQLALLHLPLIQSIQLLETSTSRSLTILVFPLSHYRLIGITAHCARNGAIASARKLSFNVAKTEFWPTVIRAMRWNSGWQTALGFPPAM